MVKSMLTQNQIRKYIERINKEDGECRSSMHRETGHCFDVGHGIRGTVREVLLSVLGESNYMRECYGPLLRGK